MGVPTFFKWLSVKYPRVLRDCKEPDCDVEGVEVPIDPNSENPNGEFDNLYLDMNGIIHPCCHPEDATCPETEEEMFTRIFEYVDRLMRIVRPRRVLYMAIDGVAPRAKMNQQRSRRFKTAAEVDQEEANYEELKAEFEREGREVPPPKAHWDSNVITPGTRFLHSLSQALAGYIDERMATDLIWRNMKVVLSDANCPGEGEHKIMHFIRAQRTYPGYDPNTRHCLYGADADLIMLGLATHEPYFSIMREAVLEAAELRKCFLCGMAGHMANECNASSPAAVTSGGGSFKSSWKPLQFLHINILREYLQVEFTFKEYAGFNPDFERCVDDFVLMCFFVGNDFLPHLPSLSIHKGSIDQMLLLYQHILPRLPSHLTETGKLQSEAVQIFVDHLGKVEAEVFREELRRRARIQQLQAEDSSRLSAQSSTSLDDVTRVSAEDENFAALHEWKRGSEDGQEAEQSFGSEPIAKKIKLSREGNIDEFKAQMRSKAKEQSEIRDAKDVVQLGVGSSSEWRERYYKLKFHLTEEDVQGLDEFAARVAESYVEGLRWVLGYYYCGVPSWNWFYSFHYAPLASDIAMFGLKHERPFELGAPFLPFEQLMAVLPARSGHCLPPVLSQLMVTRESPLIDFYPKHFKEDPDGKRFRWQWVALLPFVDQERLQAVLKPLFADQLKPEEAERNRTSEARVFVSQFHPLAQQISLIQLARTDSEKKQSIVKELGDFLFGILQYSPLGSLAGQPLAPPLTEKPVAGSIGSFAKSSSSCEFICEPQTSHVCRFLPGTIQPPAVLSKGDSEAAGGNERRFNAGPARRLIMASLGRQGVVDQRVVDRFFQALRNSPRNGQPLHADNRYERETFGSRKRQREPPGPPSVPGPPYWQRPAPFCRQTLLSVRVGGGSLFSSGPRSLSPPRKRATMLPVIWRHPGAELPTAPRHSHAEPSAPPLFRPPSRPLQQQTHLRVDGRTFLSQQPPPPSRTSFSSARHQGGGDPYEVERHRVAYAGAPLPHHSSRLPRPRLPAVASRLNSPLPNSSKRKAPWS